MWDLLKTVGRAVLWIAKAAITAAVWAAAHPFVALGLAVGLFTLSAWAGSQDWMGASVVADLAAGFGYTMMVSGLLGWVFPAAGKAAAAALGVWLGWLVEDPPLYMLIRARFGGR